MPRRYNSKETVEMILTAAIKRFNEKGYEKTSMQEIVDESGVSKGSIFHHFNSKEEILAAVIINQAKAHEQTVRKWLNEMNASTAREKMIAYFDSILDYTHTDALDALNEQILKSPQIVLTLMQENLKIAAPLFAKIFREGIEDGSITVDFPEECAEALILLINYWCNSTLFECNPETLINRIKLLQQMMKQMGADIISDNHVSKIAKL